MGLKGRFPFRIGTTSFVLPSDIQTNVEYLAGKVDDIELVLFESDDTAELPDKGTVEVLRSIAVRDNLTYTVHLPLDIRLGDTDQAERSRSVNKCLRVMERMDTLNPFAYILHCDGNGFGDSPSDHCAVWQNAVEKSIDQILGSGAAPENICIETLDYPFELIEQIVESKGLSVCLDIGHIQREGHSVPDYLSRYLKYCRVIHLHGITQGKDHCALSKMDKALLTQLFSQLGSDTTHERVVTLEVFTTTAFDRSLSVIKEILP